VVTLGADGLAEVGPHVVALAGYEGLPAHAESIRIREPAAGAGAAAGASAAGEASP
jgi:histidinol dehydrogenase